MSILQGDPLPDVKTTTTQATTAPGYYTDYLSNLARAGNAGVNMDPSQMVAGFSNLQQQGFGNTANAATSYMPQLTAAQQTAGDVAQGVTPQEMGQFFNPYTSSVVDELGRKTQQNIQQNILPSLKGMFAASGGMGSQRMMNATGQTLADIQANLSGQQAGLLQKGYSDSINQALEQERIQNTAGQLQGNLAGTEQQLGLAGNKALLDAGAIQQAYEQAQIEAPLKMASNASALMRGYSIPTTTTQNFTGPMPGAYGTSPLAAVAGVGSLFATGNNGGISAAQGIGTAAKDAYNWLKTLGNPAAPAGTNISQSNVGGIDGYYSGDNNQYIG